MIISRTPYRISFFGGGTDYPSWYEQHGGAVLSTTIDKFCYITARYLPPFHSEKSRVVWSKIEAVKDNDDIEHNSVRACLQHFGIKNGIEIHHTGDLPARSGLGSSSAFTVGMINALYGLTDKLANKIMLAEDAIRIERDILRENVGIQDQIATAYGGFNYVEINSRGKFTIAPVVTTHLQRLQDHCLLFFTGISRTASEIASEQIKAHVSGDKDYELRAMQQMVYPAGVAINLGDMNEIGKLLHESWNLKRSLAKNISPPVVDEIYEAGCKAGAIGGKLLGAGGGGFMLFFAPPETHDAIRKELKTLLYVPFKFENEGSQIIYRS